MVVPFIVFRLWVHICVLCMCSECVTDAVSALSEVLKTESDAETCMFCLVFLRVRVLIVLVWLLGARLLASLANLVYCNRFALISVLSDSCCVSSSHSVCVFVFAQRIRPVAARARVFPLVSCFASRINNRNSKRRFFATRAHCSDHARSGHHSGQ